MSAAIYVLSRYYKAAILIFGDNEIVIRGKALRATIPIHSIRKIYCNDARNIKGDPKEKLSITIERKRKRKAMAIKLKNYSEAEEFMEQLMKYESIELKFYDFSFNPTHMEEE